MTLAKPQGSIRLPESLYKLLRRARGKKYIPEFLPQGTPPSPREGRVNAKTPKEQKRKPNRHASGGQRWSC
jgi:hypothetical protein